jgi:hypothetical protein
MKIITIKKNKSAVQVYTPKIKLFWSSNSFSWLKYKKWCYILPVREVFSENHVHLHQVGCASALLSAFTTCVKS